MQCIVCCKNFSASADRIRGQLLENLLFIDDFSALITSMQTFQCIKQLKKQCACDKIDWLKVT